MVTTPVKKATKRARRGAGEKRWERRRESRPGEIVAAAVQLFSERGFAGTRMEDVAARAGVTKATVYLYFEDKQALFKAVVIEAMAPNMDCAEALVAAFDGSTPKLLELLVTLFEGILETQYTALAKMIISEAEAFPELSRLYAELVLTRGFALLTSILQRGVDRGELRPLDPAATAPLFMAPIILLALWKHSFGPRTDLMPPARVVLRQHLDVFLHGIAAPGAELPPSRERRRRPPR